MIEDYVGTNGTTINIESRQEVFDAIDIMQTQVMQNMPKDEKMALFLGQVLDKLSKDFKLYPS